MKLCIGMIDAGKAYNAANKQFVNGIRELAQQSTKDEVIEVNKNTTWLDLSHRKSPAFELLECVFVFFHVWGQASFWIFFKIVKYLTSNKVVS